MFQEEGNVHLCRNAAERLVKKKKKKLARNYWIDKIKTMADFDKGSSGEVVGAEAYLGR